MTLFMVIGFILGTGAGVWATGVVLFRLAKGRWLQALFWPVIVVIALIRESD